MTTAVRQSPTRYLTDTALAADIEATRKQLFYAGALDAAGELLPGIGDPRLEAVWGALVAEANARAGH